MEDRKHSPNSPEKEEQDRRSAELFFEFLVRQLAKKWCEQGNLPTASNQPPNDS